ncbi:hypothetical protein B4Q13_22085, partial [Lacticaseibacillus rhamnosus]
HGDEYVVAAGTIDEAWELDYYLHEIPELNNNLGLILWGVGDRAAAEKQFRAALRIQPGVSERSRQIDIGRESQTRRMRTAMVSPSKAGLPVHRM